MKKFYSLAVLALMALAGQAKTVSVSVDNSEAVTQVFNTSTYNYEYLPCTTNIGTYGGIVVYFNEGYECDGYEIDGKAVSISGDELQNSLFSDNSTLYIKSRKKEQKFLYVKADPSRVSLSVNYYDTYNADNMTDGQWTVNITNDVSVSINCAEGYILQSVTKSNGASAIDSYSIGQSYASFYTAGYANGEVVTIDAISTSELPQATLSLAVDGADASSIRVQTAQYKTIDPSDYASFTITPMVDCPLQIGRADYGTIYKIEVNGVAQPAPEYGNIYSVSNLKDGDAITVYPNYPEGLEAPVSFAFTNPGTQGAVKTVRVDYEIVDPQVWMAEDFKVGLGKKLDVEFNTSNFQISEVTLNGQYVSTYGYSTTVNTTDAYNFVISATKQSGYQVTINYEPGTIKAFIGYGQDNPVVLPEDRESVTIEVMPGEPYLNFVALDGYKITEVVDQLNTKYTYFPIYISGSCELTVYAEEYKRDQTCVIYLQETDIEWSYTQVTIDPSGDRVGFGLNAGYNFVNYNRADRPFSFSLYSNSDAVHKLYLNGQELEGSYGTYPALETMPDNSVLKDLTEDFAQTYELTIDNALPNVTVLADYITELSEAKASVFGPTDVKFQGADKDVVIKVNEQEVTPNEEGIYVVRIASDAAISIKGKQTAIRELDAQATPSVVYDLQGKRVANPRSGLYIVNGKVTKL